MARKSQSLIAAASWVQDLMDLLTVADHFNKRTTAEAVRLLRAGCAKTVFDGNKHWDDNVSSFHGLETGEALLLLSNELATYEERFTLDDIYREFK
jgi:hypothetical protein